VPPQDTRKFVWSVAAVNDDDTDILANRRSTQVQQRREIARQLNFIGVVAATGISKRGKMRSATIALMLILSMSVRPARADSCGDILHDGVFDVTHISDDQALKEAYRQWQCVTEINNWSDAKGFGLGVGVPIYGVPVKIDTNYTKDHREQWQKQNCKTEDLNRDSRQVRDELYRHTNPDIVAAWKECMFTRNTKGLRCEVDGDDERVTLTYRYDPHTNDDAKTDTILDSFYSYGVRVCFGSPSPGTAVGVAGTKISCERERSSQGAVSKTGFVLNLKNGKGSCDSSVAGHTAVAAPCAQFVGTKKFETDATIREQRICMKEGTVLRILHGHSLTIEAEEVSIEGSGALIDASGDQETVVARGAPIRIVTITARTEIVTRLVTQIAVIKEGKAVLVAPVVRLLLERSLRAFCSTT
jgi:hypothetical protein